MKQKDDPEVAPWIARRDEDLEMMAVALEHAPRLRDAIAFHAQQAAEKSMKALLAAAGVEPPHVHDLVFLLEEIEKVLPVASISPRDCQFLTPFATMARYPQKNRPLPARGSCPCGVQEDSLCGRRDHRGWVMGEW